MLCYLHLCSFIQVYQSLICQLFPLEAKISSKELPLCVRNPNYKWDLQGLELNSHRTETDKLEKRLGNTEEIGNSTTPTATSLLVLPWVRSCFVFLSWFDILTAPLCCHGNVSNGRRLQWDRQLSEVATMLWCYCQDMVDGEFDFWLNFFRAQKSGLILTAHLLSN